MPRLLLGQKKVPRLGDLCIGGIERLHKGRCGSADSCEEDYDNDNTNAGKDETGDGETFLGILLAHADDGEDQTESPQNPVEDGDPAENQAEQSQYETGNAHAVLLLLNNNFLSSVFFHNTFPAFVSGATFVPLAPERRFNCCFQRVGATPCVKGYEKISECKDTYISDIYVVFLMKK